jgi:hypothetical protein
MIKAMLKIEEVEVGHRYLLKEVHVDGDEVFEVAVEQKVSKDADVYLGLRLISSDDIFWRETWRLQVIKELQF